MTLWCANRERLCPRHTEEICESELCMCVCVWVWFFFRVVLLWLFTTLDGSFACGWLPGHPCARWDVLNTEMVPWSIYFCVIYYTLGLCVCAVRVHFSTTARHEQEIQHGSSVHWLWVIMKLFAWQRAGCVSHCGWCHGSLMLRRHGDRLQWKTKVPDTWSRVKSSRVVRQWKRDQRRGGQLMNI